MILPIYIADAFCTGLFTGNPAAVCVTGEWLNEALMQQIAAQNNLSETAFVVRKNDGFDIRWFTPATEVLLAGHPTMAAAHILFTELNYSDDVILFHSSGNKLAVKREKEEYILDLPADTIKEVEVPMQLRKAFIQEPVDCFKGKYDYMLVFKTQLEVEEAMPDLNKIAGMDCRGVIITAPGNEFDFVSRYFAPQSGINEDPVTGSAHATLVPYWWQRYGRIKMNAMQLSKRTGLLSCAYLGERIEIGGNCRTYLRGQIDV